MHTKTWTQKFEKAYLTTFDKVSCNRQPIQIFTRDTKHQSHATSCITVRRADIQYECMHGKARYIKVNREIRNTEHTEIEEQ